MVSKLFRAYGLYNGQFYGECGHPLTEFQSSFELTGYITVLPIALLAASICFKALSSLRVI